ncbi:MAG: hypothetical protein LBI81_01715 [Puniceicoccales bacterium]|jgi:hypothetical protein|nr:hypothetical protein [Puniceicoccales bacterium]
MEKLADSLEFKCVSKYDSMKISLDLRKESSFKHAFTESHSIESVDTTTLPPGLLQICSGQTLFVPKGSSECFAFQSNGGKVENYYVNGEEVSQKSFTSKISHNKTLSGSNFGQFPIVVPFFDANSLPLSEKSPLLSSRTVEEENQ